MNIDTSLKAIHFSKGKRDIAGIILHDTCGSGTHNDTLYLARPGDGRKVSVDFTVERDGNIYQLNHDLTNQWTYHAGRSTKFKTYRNAQVNQHCIGIEIVQKADLSLLPTYPEEQVRIVAALCAALCVQFKLSKADITTHKQVITDGSRTDPRMFPFDRFWNEFNGASALMNGTASRDAMTHVVVKGDTLWALSRKYSTPVEEIKRLSGMNSSSNLLQIGQTLIVKQ